MPLFSESLYHLRGRVRNAKPNAQPEAIRTWLNDAIREVINTRTYWADLLVTGVISIPNPYATGTASVATGSTTATGTGTAWPTNDLVNTNLQTEIFNPGYAEVTPGNMAGIAEDGILWVDAGSPVQEAVPIIRTGSDSFTGKFAHPHPLGVSATQSSLVGRQFRMGYNFPIFTVWAVPSSTSVVLDTPWGGPPITNGPYQILLMYVTMDSKIRKLMDAIDQQQGWPLDLESYSYSLINSLDPQRADQSDPRTIVPFRPSLAGNQQWEVWPSGTTARQIGIMYSRQWPEMIDDTDMPPPFIEPTLFSNLAIATALRTKVGREDPWFIPNESTRMDKMAAIQLQQIMNNDEDRQVRDYQNLRRSLIGGRSFNWAQNHGVSSWEQQFTFF